MAEQRSLSTVSSDGFLARFLHAAASRQPADCKMRSLFQHNLALENDYLRAENKILRSKLGPRVPLTDADRRILVRFGLKIKHRLRHIASIATPDTLLA